MRYVVLLLSLLIVCTLPAVAQKKPVKKPAPAKTQTKTQAKPVKEQPKTAKEEAKSTAGDDKKVRDMVAFLQYMLNTLASSSTSPADKDVLVTESYSKIFRDNKVQVEDDLDNERKVITNKDIVAYLKDVDFFFEDAKFELVIDQIKPGTRGDGSTYYTVHARRNLTGTSPDGSKVSNSIVRYIDVNYDTRQQDLKIVSIYTNEYNEKEALTNWWRDLSYEWQSIFSQLLDLPDSASLADIKKVTAIQELTLRNNKYIQDLEPLAQLAGLQVLDLSGTKINDLTPIRNLTELTELQAANTNVTDLTPLRYSTKLERLILTNTKVTEVLVLENMTQLAELDLRHTAVKDLTPLTELVNMQKADLSFTQAGDFTPLQGMQQLKELSVAGTPLVNATPIGALKNMETLTLDSTKVSDVAPLAALQNLKVLQVNSTSVTNLQPLQKLVHLEKIYCDHTSLTREQADAFMAKNPGTLVILDSEDIKAWWDKELTPAWQEVLARVAGISRSPAKEELARLTLLDSLNLDGNAEIDDLEPVRKLTRLKTLLAARTSISDLTPLRYHTQLVLLDISGTKVRDLSPLRSLTALKTLHADNTTLASVSLHLPSLEKFYADRSGIHDTVAGNFLERNPACLLVYKSDRLKSWWNELPEAWKKAFRKQVGNEATRETLHQLVEQESVEIKDAQVSSLSALREFVRLKELHFSGTAITSITILDQFKSLTALHATNSPIQKIDSIYLLTNLEDLDISNTPVDDIYATWKLKKLKKLNCAGTLIKRLDGLEKLEQLEYLDCSNTTVSKLKPLDYLPLTTLKCYNTRLTTRAIENFKAVHPDCQVIYYR